MSTNQSLAAALTKPVTLDEQIDSICGCDSYITAVSRIKTIVANKDGYSIPQIREILEAAQAREVRATKQRPAVRTALRNALKKLPAAAEVTTELPKDPAWDQVREVSENLKLCGRLFLRGQVKLGMLLAALKKANCSHGGNRKNQVADSATWSEIVTRETGYSRRQSDEFIRLYEASIAKLKTAKKLSLPAPVKKDALAIFRAENPLTLTDEQWAVVDEAIGSLTSGETQSSLLEELGIVKKPKPMPKGGGGRKGDDGESAGQLAFHFFEAMTAPLINARTNPEYRKLLFALPVESDEAHPLSLATIEAEARALLADIEEARRTALKPAKGRTVTV